MTDKRTCGNCVEVLYVYKGEFGCRENRFTKLEFISPDLMPACSRHLYYDEVFGDRDELRERLQIVSRETSGVIRTDE